MLRREVLINEGDIYNDAYWEYSVVKLNQLGYFNPIDKDKDVDRRTNDEEATVDLALKVSERGRQQISFNGGISGIGGSFFGLEYSTNNLLGRGEVLSFNIAAGNRQRSFQFSFTEPYIKDRPISAGFSSSRFRRSSSARARSSRRTFRRSRTFSTSSSISTTSTNRTCSRAIRTADRSS